MHITYLLKQRILHECSCFIEFIKRVGEKDKMRGSANNTGARMQGSVYHMTLNSHFISEFMRFRL